MFEVNNLTSAGKYFLVISGELLALFIGISFLVALLQEFVPEETTRKVLGKPRRWLGNILGLFLFHYSNFGRPDQQWRSFWRHHVISYFFTIAQPCNPYLVFNNDRLEDYSYLWRNNLCLRLDYWCLMGADRSGRRL